MADKVDVGIKVSAEGAEIAADVAKLIANLRKELEKLYKTQTSAEAKSARAAQKAADKQAKDELAASARQIAVDRKASLAAERAARKQAEDERKSSAKQLRADRKKAADEEKEYNRQFAELLKQERALEREAARQRKAEAKQAGDERKASARQLLVDRKAALAAEKAHLIAERDARRQAREDRLADQRLMAADRKKAASDQRAANAAARAEQRAVVTAQRAASAAAREAAKAEREKAKAAAEHNKVLQAQSEVMRRLYRDVLALAAAYVGFRQLKLLITQGLEFNKVMENSSLGIASLIAAQTKMTNSAGQVVEGQAKLGIAQVLAAEQVRKLRIAGLQTVATTQELVVAFQQATGVGLRFGLTLDQIRQITIQMVQAATTLNVPLHQMSEEIRSLLTGTITPRNTRIATALGITNKQIKEAQKAGTLLEFITGRLESFTHAGEESAKTFTGTMNRIREALQNVAGDATKPLFETLKLTGQSAIADIFDLKNARVSQSFSGILEIAEDVFTGVGDLLADSIESGVDRAKALSEWFTESRLSVTDLTMSTRLFAHEIKFLLADVIDLVTGLGEAGTETGLFANVMKGAAFAAAEIHTAFQGLVIVLGFIGGVILTAIILPFVGFLKIAARVASVFDEDLADALQASANTAQGFVAGLRGQVKEYIDDLALAGTANEKFEARVKGFEGRVKTAALAHGTLRDTLRKSIGDEDRLTNALEINLKKRLLTQKDYTNQVRKIRIEQTDIQIAAQEKYMASLDKEEVRERQRTQHAIDELKKRKGALLHEVTLSAIAEPPEDEEKKKKETVLSEAFIRQQEKAKLKDLKISLDNEEIAYRDYYARVTQVQQDTFDKLIQLEKDEMATATDQASRDRHLDKIKAHEAEKLQVIEDNNEKLLKDEQDLQDEIVRLNVQLLKDQGRLVDARSEEIMTKFRSLIRRLTIEGNLGGIIIAAKLFSIETAKVKLDEMGRTSRLVMDNLQVRLGDIQVQQEVHAITDLEAREKIAAAYTEARNSLQAMIPAMEEAARLTEDPNQVLAVMTLKTRLAEMGLVIKKNTDLLFDLKEAARDSVTQGLANVIAGMSTLPFQDTTEVDALTEQLSGARRELERLMAGPQDETSSQRARELREEIRGVTLELKDAEDEIRDWRDLFIDAARSIVDSLKQVAAQMLANLIIQQVLRSLNIGGAAVSSAIPNSALGLPGRAQGGYISGPGTPTSDSIPAWLSTGEFVVRASAVKAVGRNFLEAVNGSTGSTLRKRYHFADGGMVPSPAASGATGGFDATIGLEEGLVAKHLKSKEGTRAIVGVLASNRKALRQILGV